MKLITDKTFPQNHTREDDYVHNLNRIQHIYNLRRINSKNQLPIGGTVYEDRRIQQLFTNTKQKERK